MVPYIFPCPSIRQSSPSGMVLFSNIDFQCIQFSTLATCMDPLNFLEFKMLIIDPRTIKYCKKLDNMHV